MRREVFGGHNVHELVNGRDGRQGGTIPDGLEFQLFVPGFHVRLIALYLNEDEAPVAIQRDEVVLFPSLVDDLLADDQKPRVFPHHRGDVLGHEILDVAFFHSPVLEGNGFCPAYDL
jgi:hypothetical protein